MHFRKIGIKSGIHFGKIGIRNRYVFETSMARPRPKAGQVPPPGDLRNLNVWSLGRDYNIFVGNLIFGVHTGCI